MGDSEDQPDPALYSLAQYWDQSDDGMLTCPYDSSHKIRRFRIEHHLIQCRKNHPDAQVATCPYNATHVLPVKFFVDHVAGCPDIRLVDPDQGQARSDRGFSGRRIYRGTGGGLPLDNSHRFLTVDKQDRYEPAPIAESTSSRSGEASTSVLSAARPPRFTPRSLIARNFRSGQTDGSFDISQSIRENLGENIGPNYVENHVIIGGVASLLSCGGVNPVSANEAESTGNNSSASVTKIPDDKPVGTGVFYQTRRAHSRALQQRDRDTNSPVVRGDSAQTI